MIERNQRDFRTDPHLLQLFGELDLGYRVQEHRLNELDISGHPQSHVQLPSIVQMTVTPDLPLSRQPLEFG